MTGGSAFNSHRKKYSMNATANLNKLSDKVYQELKLQGYSKLFNWEDYHYFKKQAQDEFNKVEAIVQLFIFYSCDLSDFEDYDF